MATLLMNLALRLGLILPFHRIEETPCPEIVLKHLPTAVRWMVPWASKRFRVLIMASYALAHVVGVFIAAGLVRGESPTAVYFVRATYFYAHRLILHSFELYTGEIGSNFHASEFPPEFRTLLGQTEDAIRRLKSSLEALDGAIETDGWSLDLTTLPSAALVPTACPFQLFVETFVATSADVAAEVNASQDDADLILRIKDLLLRRLDTVFQHARTDKAGDAQPKTTAMLVYHDDNRVERVLIGCSGPDWTGFDEIVGVVKTLRFIRLTNYAPFSIRAFYSQWAVEDWLREKNGSDKSPDKNLLWEARKGTIEEMKKHKSFLGRRKGEVCGAFKTPSWAYLLACYVCKGTLGYREAVAQTEAAQRVYYVPFD